MIAALTRGDLSSSGAVFNWNRSGLCSRGRRGRGEKHFDRHLDKQMTSHISKSLPRSLACSNMQSHSDVKYILDRNMQNRIPNSAAAQWNLHDFHVKSHCSVQCSFCAAAVCKKSFLRVNLIGWCVYVCVRAIFVDCNSQVCCGVIIDNSRL